ncbi:hypothetical protein [Neisseria bergeri]|uniref:hypothetical protein n=1 Tax=Neisseria bergeri TaxID=1906581 RepID=UPI000D30121B|nr:hypothetical protein [Neisseria bergeri]
MFINTIFKHSRSKKRIPAKIENKEQQPKIRHSRLRGNDGVFRVAVFCGNDEALDCEDLSLPPSFPRKWESRNEKQQEFIGNDRN